ncbi:MAG: hypothetical protein NZ602_02065 [Thermoguttaceae bacterium]|nr:hypothetical protein [Thermoguttaceae bacterium]MDW8039781.1 hypothetical protein [Thermoguttaceae bacterium]
MPPVEGCRSRGMDTGPAALVLPHFWEFPGVCPFGQLRESHPQEKE